MPLSRLILLVLVCFTLTLSCLAQTAEEIDSFLYSGQLDKAEQALTQALEKSPSDFELVRRQGYLFVLRSSREPDSEKARALRVKAREALIKARDLGDEDSLAASILENIPPDGGTEAKLSAVPEAHRAMKQAEAAFASQQYVEAVKYYQEASQLDPGLYTAPLYEGDAWVKLSDLDKARTCYAKAVALDPNRETAYRYWGNSYLRSGEVEQALEKFCQAVVAEPISKMAWNRGLGEWARLTDAKLDIPKIRIKAGLQGESITVSPEEGNDELAAWLVYPLTLALWKNERFAEKFPAQEYRHSLYEEADALSSVAQVAEELQAKGELEPGRDLLLLMELKGKGLMEAFVFFSRPSREIFLDYDDYRKIHRDRLVRFVMEYVIQRESL